MVLNNMEKIIDLFTQMKQFVSTSGHSVMIILGTCLECLYLEPIYNNILSFNRNAFVNCAYIQHLRWN